MGHHCEGEPRTVGELIVALSALDPSLPLLESWDEGAGWFEVAECGGEKVVWIGVHGPCTRDDNPDQLTEDRVMLDIQAGFEAQKMET